MPKALRSGKDRFGDLTNDLLRHVLSYLPRDDALQTCVLDTRWRGLWRRTVRLQFILEEMSRFPGCDRFGKLVKLVIHLRGNSPLVKCEINAYPDDETEGTYTNTMRFIEYALTCQVKDLLVRAAQNEVYPLTFDAPLISQHLKTIELERVNLECSALNFSGCPVLEGLKMIHCWTYARRISSESLKYLCITGSCSILDDSHMRIYTPALISLQLDDFHGSTPYLENMPFLVAAYVCLGKGCCDFTFCNINMEEDCDVPCCACHAYPDDEGVLLNGLTHAVNLELIAEPEKIIYSWDLERLPVFGNLKTLLLNEWFTTIDLVCILQHSPALEMLTLQLGNTEKLIGTTGAQETVKESFVCTHLKVVNIECGKVDEGIREILKILSSCGVLRKQISIKDPCSCSDCFSFQKRPTASTTHGA